ncbi:hypothetical protein DFH06DRAFT_1310143 [Mycena polygramma]|nr:hypothetical protein DFH06DRAFT_1310143 [Mycena polygramma]
MAQERNGLEELFNGSQSLTAKIVDILQALSTVCTRRRGKDNGVAVMAGFTDSQLYLFCAQNASGGTTAELSAHLSGIWASLRQTHHITTVSAPPSTSSSPRAIPEAQKPTVKKLDDMVYLFVREKALNRAAKRFPIISALYKQRQWTHLQTDQKKLLSTLFDVAEAAEQCLSLRDQRTLATEPWWLLFRAFLQILRHLTIQPTFEETFHGLQKEIAVARNYKYLGFGLRNGLTP